ncbi:MAG: hypothetical protein RR295_10680, partial [Oscillospiraceae bacterium]
GSIWKIDVGADTIRPYWHVRLIFSISMQGESPPYWAHKVFFGTFLFTRKYAYPRLPMAPNLSTGTAARKTLMATFSLF